MLRSTLTTTLRLKQNIKSTTIPKILSLLPSSSSKSYSTSNIQLNKVETTTNNSSTSSSTTNTGISTPSYGIYPGDKRINYVSNINVYTYNKDDLLPCFRIMDEEGNIRNDAKDPNIDRDTLVKAYTYMVRVSIMDMVLYDCQRQGRISFYMTSGGEEATHIGSAMALQQTDEIFAQYREQGVLLWRGFTLQNICDQCFGNVDDVGKGRQMPVHYGSKAQNFQTISSPLATQIPQAAGAAYLCKLEKKGRAVICYFGEGAASEGDFHAGFNMSTTQKVPLIFFCRNNGFAISTPVENQYGGDGIAARGRGYGMHTIRVDGNDIFAVYEATKLARSIALGEDGTGKTKPVLIEAMTYREGHHSTSDDSTRYRKPEEIQLWRTRSNPIKRLRAYLERKGWWDAEQEKALLQEERKAILTAVSAAEHKPRPSTHSLFEDVYKEIPKHIAEQQKELEEHMNAYPTSYPSGHGH